MVTKYKYNIKVVRNKREILATSMEDALSRFMANPMAYLDIEIECPCTLFALDGEKELFDDGCIVEFGNPFFD